MEGKFALTPQGSFGAGIHRLHLRVVPIRGKGVGVFIHPHPSHWDVNSQALLLLPALGQVGFSISHKGPQGLAVGSDSTQGVCAKMVAGSKAMWVERR